MTFIEKDPVTSTPLLVISRLYRAEPVLALRKLAALLFAAWLASGPSAAAQEANGLSDSRSNEPHTKKLRLPNQGAFRNGQAMYDWLGGAGDIWWDGSNPINSVSAVERFVRGESNDAVKPPRPKKVKLYLQGSIPRLPKFTYQQCADNVPEVRAQWVAMARVLADAGYDDCVFGSSETQTHSKAWHPSAEDITSGRWKKAWMNMVDDVRSVLPGARFAFVPLSGGQDGHNASPYNGIVEKDEWYVAERDKAGRPYMDFWGLTLYFGTGGAKSYADSPVTKEVIDKSMQVMSRPVTNCHTNWGVMGQFQYAKEKGIKLVIGELGIFDRFKGDRPQGMGDQPYAIDLLTRFVAEHADEIELVCWFNSRGLESARKSGAGSTPVPPCPKPPNASRNSGARIALTGDSATPTLRPGGHQSPVYGSVSIGTSISRVS